MNLIKSCPSAKVLSWRSKRVEQQYNQTIIFQNIYRKAHLKMLKLHGPKSTPKSVFN